MNEDLIIRICKVYNKGQDEYKISETAPYGNLYVKRKSLGNDYDSDEVGINVHDVYAIHGFLIDREFGFFEALLKIKHDIKARYVVEGTISKFALVKDKEAWLDENLPSLKELKDE